MNTSDIVITSLITGVIEVIKPFIKDTRLYPILSILLGIALSLGINGLEVKNLFTGLVYGLSASGFYSTINKTIELTK